MRGLALGVSLLLLSLGSSSSSIGQVQAPSAPQAPPAPAVAQPPLPQPPVPQPPVPQPPTPTPATKIDTSEAARILRTRESIKKTNELIENLRMALEDPKSEYQVTRAEQERVTSELRAKQIMLTELEKQGDDAAIAKQKASIAESETELAALNERLQSMTQQRAAKQSTLIALTRQLQKEQEELDRLEGRTKPPPTTPAPTPPPVASEKADPSTGGNLPAVPGLPMPAAPPANTTPPNRSEKIDPEIARAKERLAASLKAYEEAQSNLKNTQARYEAIQNSIQAVTSLLEAENASLVEKQAALQKLRERQNDPNLEMSERVVIAPQMTDLEYRIGLGRERIIGHQNKLDFLTSELRAVEQELEAAQRETEESQRATKSAESELEEIRNPFTLRSVLRWLVNHGPNVLIIGLVASGLFLLVRTFSKNIVNFILQASNRGHMADRENRASTLVGVFRYISAILIIGGGTVMLLDEAGIPIVPLMGGAAVFGLAVAFGAQNLIKDYFSGFMMLMEDQYGVNDVVRIGNTSGLVEEITLRITVLRDLEGVRHFIPHGSVTQVSNMTHTWSRALFDIPVAYHVNVDQAIAVLMQLAHDLRKDPIHGQNIIEEPEMLGVDQFGASAIIIKFFLKTKPLKQWLVRRELLRRIKNKFDELNIEIPLNCHTVYMRTDEQPVLPAPTNGQSVNPYAMPS